MKKSWIARFSIKLPRLKLVLFWGAAIAQWIYLRLQSCRPRFEFQAYHLRFYQCIIVSRGNDETTNTTIYL